MKWQSNIKRVWDNPLLAIEWTLAICTFIGTFYIFTPLYAIGKALHPSVLTTLLTYPITIMIWASVLLLGVCLVLAGLIKNNPKLRAPGWFMVFLARLYQVLAILIVAGPIPLQWLFPFTLGLIVLIFWAKARGES